jgi:hypothetical protein
LGGQISHLKRRASKAVGFPITRDHPITRSPDWWRYIAVFREVTDYSIRHAGGGAVAFFAVPSDFSVFFLGCCFYFCHSERCGHLRKPAADLLAFFSNQDSPSFFRVLRSFSVLLVARTFAAHNDFCPSQEPSALPRFWVAFDSGLLLAFAVQSQIKNHNQ